MPTSTDLAIRANTGLAEKIEYATELSKSDLLPRAYRDQPANILLVMEFGDYLGLPPVAALRLIHIIDNKPVASAELIAGRVRSAGHRLRVSYDPEKKTAVCSIWRADDTDFEFRAEWSWDRAAAVRDKNGQALTQKLNWRNYYPAMLKWRATTECARDACPEILLGVSYTPDELGAPALDDADADAIGVMTTAQRVEHNDLRRMGEPDPGAVEILDAPDPDDPWTEPQAEMSAQDTDARLEKIRNKDKVKAKYKALAFSDEELHDLITWLAPSWPDRTAVRTVDSFLADHLTAAEGDVEEARSRIWTQYHEANPEAASDGA
jgi:hypothetical protein